MHPSCSIRRWLRKNSRLQILVRWELEQSIPTVVHTVPELPLWTKEILRVKSSQYYEQLARVHHMFSQKNIFVKTIQLLRENHEKPNKSGTQGFSELSCQLFVKRVHKLPFVFNFWTLVNGNPHVGYLVHIKYVLSLIIQVLCFVYSTWAWILVF